MVGAWTYRRTTAVRARCPAGPFHDERAVRPVRGESARLVHVAVPGTRRRGKPGWWTGAMCHIHARTRSRRRWRTCSSRHAPRIPAGAHRRCWRVGPAASAHHELAGGEHRRRSPGASWAGPPAPRAPDAGTSGRGAPADRRPERSLDGSLQRAVPNWGWRLLLPAHTRGPAHALSAQRPRAALDEDGAHDARVRAGVPGVWASLRDPHRQWRRRCDSGRTRPLVPERLVDGPRHPTPTEPARVSAGQWRA